MDSNHRLAVYGTLAPGRPNADQLDGLEGRWFEGQVYGTVIAAGWGAHLGFPGLILDPEGESVDVLVFESADLPAHWARLDEFEGSGYQRVVTAVHVLDGDIDAYIYAVGDPDER